MKGNNTGTRARIEDVAKAAGVSMKTVSRVLNHEPYVREETRRRVEQAVAGLQYRPNLSARSLAGQRAYVVVLVYDNPSRNYLMEIQGGVLEACRSQHFSLVLAPVDPGDRRYLPELVELVEYSQADGLVLVPPLTDDSALLTHLRKRGVPFACISPRHAGERIGVALDERAAARELVAHLVNLGHRRIAHIKGPAGHGASTWRHSGYRDALKAAGIVHEPALVVGGEFTFDSGVDAARKLLDLRAPPTAIFAANDDMAAGVLRVASERGLQVPRDLSVCGYDDTPLSRNVSPALTTVHQPAGEMGRVAAQELLKAIRDHDSGDMVQVTYELRLRDSTARPRRASAAGVRASRDTAGPE
jgi:LacI family transcriptional regulator